MKGIGILIGVMATLLFVNTIHAQDKRKQWKSKKLEREHQRFGKLTQELDLSSQQKKEVYELIQVRELYIVTNYFCSIICINNENTILYIIEVTTCM